MERKKVSTRMLVGAAIALTVAVWHTAAQSQAPAPPPDGRRGVAVPGKENTPNGGRPEIHDVKEMREVGGYKSPGGTAYSDLAAEAGGTLWPVTLYYRCKNTPGGTALEAKPPVPLEVFDGVYSIGHDANNIWAIKTSAGVVLIDTLSNEVDVRQFIVPGLAKFGLKPTDIKYVFVTHNHGDHTGGLTYLRSLAPDIKVGMSELDWVPALRTANDFVVTDGMKITLGDFTITAIVTGGHTRGTISFVFPVKDKDTPHMASLFGGQGSPTDLPALLNFRRSLSHFADYTDLVQADVVLSNHTVGDDGLTKIAQLQRRKPGDPNPYVVGREGVIRYDAEWRNCLSADIAERVSEGKTYDPQAVGTPVAPPARGNPGRGRGGNPAGGRGNSPGDGR
jgi:metallo-beta-lactamase class B